MLLAIGTGIGSAVLTGGRIVAGAGGGACSFGWAAADLDDSGEERSGWLERQASGRALDAAARGLDIRTAWPWSKPPAAAMPRLRLQPLRRPCGLWVRRLPELSACSTLRPIILAGGVAASLDVLAPLILETLRRQLPPHLRDIQIKTGAFGPRAGLVGAAFAGASRPDWRNHHG